MGGAPGFDIVVVEHDHSTTRGLSSFQTSSMVCVCPNIDVFVAAFFSAALVKRTFKRSQSNFSSHIPKISNTGIDLAPNQRSRLLYENDDAEHVSSFEKKG